MLRYHDAIINTIIRTVGTALEKNLNTQQLENAATIDPLTNCYNRRALCDFIENDIAFTKRYGSELSVIMIDIDNFKEINDMHGHLAGDKVLTDISALLISHVRKSDYLARYGGEEFVIVLRDTPLYSAVQLAEKLRKMVEKHAVVFGKKRIRLTASFGVASLENKPDHGSLLREADERLYKAKATGKNIVVPGLLPCFSDRTFVPKKRVRKYAAAVPLG
jgi:diguanylate cyclase (GGDEF)-like protein